MIGDIGMFGDDAPIAPVIAITRKADRIERDAIDGTQLILPPEFMPVPRGQLFS